VLFTLFFLTHALATCFHACPAGAGGSLCDPSTRVRRLNGEGGRGEWRWRRGAGEQPGERHFVHAPTKRSTATPTRQLDSLLVHGRHPDTGHRFPLHRRPVSQPLGTAARSPPNRWLRRGQHGRGTAVGSRRGTPHQTKTAAAVGAVEEAGRRGPATGAAISATATATATGAAICPSTE